MVPSILSWAFLSSCLLLVAAENPQHPPLQGYAVYQIYPAKSYILSNTVMTASNSTDEIRLEKRENPPKRNQMWVALRKNKTEDNNSTFRFVNLAYPNNSLTQTIVKTIPTENGTAYMLECIECKKCYYYRLNRQILEAECDDTYIGEKYKLKKLFEDVEPTPAPSTTTTAATTTTTSTTSTTEKPTTKKTDPAPAPAPAPVPVPPKPPVPPVPAPGPLPGKRK